MKNTLFITAFLFFIIGCKNASEEKKATPVTNSEATYTCTNKANYGNTSICLPEIDGIVEAYSHPEVRKRATQFEDTTNTILGYYLDDATYKHVSDFSTINYDNYYKVYCAKAAKDVKMGRSEMKQIVQLMNAGFLEKTLEDLNKSELVSEKKLQISKPVLLEKYSLTKNAATIIFLMNTATEGNEQLKATALTTVLVKERLIFVAHYLTYKDEKTIATLKEHTATFIDAFIHANS